MANTFLTSKEIARKALPILQENLVFPALANLDYSGTFQKKGDVIQVKRPAVYVADEFGSTINLQDINPFPVLVKMDKIADVSVEVTASELALNLDDFATDILNPAMVAIAEKVNRDGLDLFKTVPNFTGTSGTTPDGLEDFANAAKVLDDQKSPTPDRFGVWDTAAMAKFRVLDALVGLDKSGNTAALRAGSIGDVFGLENFMTQAIKTHTAGLYTGLADVTAAITAASNEVDPLTGFTFSNAVLTSGAGTSTDTLLEGDILTLDGVQVTVIETTVAAIAGVVTAKVFPAFAADVVAGVVVFADVTNGSHVANLAFHRAAFGYVTRPLQAAAGADSSVESHGGLSLRVVMQYDINTKKTIMSIDTLYGWAPLYPELAVRILG